MKKVIAALVVFGTAAPALADVVISCTPGPGPKDVTISYDATSEINSVRAFALDLVACDYNIVEVNCLSDDYYVYVGSISIDSGGQVTDWGSCVCSSGYPGTLGGLDTNGVTIEMISLYAGEANAPSSQGDLVTVTLSCCDDCSVEVSENAIRGGVVMEDPNQIVTVTIVGCHCPPPPPPGICWDAGIRASVLASRAAMGPATEASIWPICLL
ncbi:MAG: hypothetical protein ACYTEX_26540 [Planctomycetota bacterium]|jgi:hypothetical protein